MQVDYYVELLRHFDPDKGNVCGKISAIILGLNKVYLRSIHIGHKLLEKNICIF